MINKIITEKENSIKKLKEEIEKEKEKFFNQLIQKIENDNEYAFTFYIINFPLLYTNLHLSSDVITEDNRNWKNYSELLNEENAEHILPEQIIDLDYLYFDTNDSINVMKVTTKVDFFFNGYKQVTFDKNLIKINRILSNKFQQINLNFIIALCKKCKYFTACKDKSICLSKLKF